MKYGWYWIYYGSSEKPWGEPELQLAHYTPETLGGDGWYIVCDECSAIDGWVYVVEGPLKPPTWDANRFNPTGLTQAERANCFYPGELCGRCKMVVPENEGFPCFRAPWSYACPNGQTWFNALPPSGDAPGSTPPEPTAG